MPRSGVAVPRDESARRRSAPDLGFDVDSWDDHVASSSTPGRRIVTITGHGVEAYETRNGTRPSTAQRHTQLPRYERAGFRPDRAAMWAVFLGVILLLVAAASAHAAVL